MMPHVGTVRARRRPRIAPATHGCHAPRCSRCAVQELCKSPGGPPHAGTKGRLGRKRRAGEVLQFARIELPRHGPGRGDQLPPWLVDAVAAASGLLSEHGSRREKRPTGAQAAFFPASAAIVAVSGITGASPDRGGGTQPCDIIGEVVEAACSSAGCTRRGTSSTCRQCAKPGCERGQFHQRRRFSGAATPCSTRLLRPRSARLRYALRTWHSSRRSDEPGHRRGDAHGPACVWRQE